ncbi:MAG: nicotinamide-nucleotide amidohydrolase family protein [Oscillospiraceae bacterium]
MKINKNDNSVTEKLDIVTKRVVNYLYGNKITVATAESCTGGLVSERITSVSGASEIFSLGLCTYSNQAKAEVLGVDAALLAAHGAVSESVAVSMAENAKRLAGAQIGVGITGIAGPTGGTEKKPVGTVFVAVVSNERQLVKNLALYGADGEPPDREGIRKLTAIGALEMIETLCTTRKAEVD